MHTQAHHLSPNMDTQQSFLEMGEVFSTPSPRILYFPTSPLPFLLLIFIICHVPTSFSYIFALILSSSKTQCHCNIVGCFSSFAYPVTANISANICFLVDSTSWNTHLIVGVALPLTLLWRLVFRGVCVTWILFSIIVHKSKWAKASLALPMISAREEE